MAQQPDEAVMGLRELVAAWQAQVPIAAAAYAAAVEGINRELDAVGGYASTSPDANGYCKTYFRMEGSFGGSVTKVGRVYDGPGPCVGTPAPHYPEVGDRCLELERASNRADHARQVAANAVRDLVARLGGGSDPENAALALCVDEKGERATIVRWLREGCPGLPAWERGRDSSQYDRSADFVATIIAAIERGEHLRG